MHILYWSLLLRMLVYAVLFVRWVPQVPEACEELYIDSADLWSLITL